MDRGNIILLLVIVFCSFSWNGCSKQMTTDEFEEITLLTHREVSLFAFQQMTNPDPQPEKLEEAILSLPGETLKILEKNCKAYGYTIEDYEVRRRELKEKGYRFKTEPYLVNMCE